MTAPYVLSPPSADRLPALPTGRIDTALAKLEAWFETMRGPGGYGGPVAHWWQQCFTYTGPALDWRYEGIIAGYLLLWERTGDERWLDKAQRAGDDLVAGQTPDGHFRASAFELNPATGGTPHEAACDVGLLLLAQALHRAGRPGWDAYAACAERNLRASYVGRLWDPAARSFRDSPLAPSFVPNKAATACEALFLLAELRGADRWAAQYAIPTLDRILAHQVAGRGALGGAIAQNSFGARTVDKYFPIYIARCVPALLRGYQWTGEERYAEGALRALDFIFRWSFADGSLPTVIYANRRVNRYPSWIAPLGDVLRAAELLRPLGFASDTGAVLDRVLAGQDASGGIQTAAGFAAQAGGRLGDLPDLRDLLHVAGWCDKAFRFLAAHAETLPSASAGAFAAACTFRSNKRCLVETPETLAVFGADALCFRWHKQAGRPEVIAAEFWLR